MECPCTVLGNEQHFLFRQVDCGLGKMTTQGGNSIIEPTKEIGFEDYGGKKYYEITCGEVPLQIQYTPGTEAPAASSPETILPTSSMV